MTGSRAVSYTHLDVYKRQFQQLLKDPDKLIKAQVEFWNDYLNLWEAASQRFAGHGTQPLIEPPPGDKRFKDQQWAENVVFDFIKQSYLLSADSLQGLVQSVEGLDDKTARKVQFYTCLLYTSRCV